MFVVTLDQPRLQGKKEGWIEGRRKERWEGEGKEEGPTSG